jgi:hypothetical protein
MNELIAVEMKNESVLAKIKSTIEDYAKIRDQMLEMENTTREAQK